MRRKSEEIEVYDEPEEFDDFYGKQEYHEEEDEPEAKSSEGIPTQGVRPTQTEPKRREPQLQTTPPIRYISFTAVNTTNLIGRVAAFLVVIGLGLITVFSTIMGKSLYTYQRVEKPLYMMQSEQASSSKGKRKVV